MEFEDEYQAFQFDLGMALRGLIEDRDHEQELLYVILEGMTGIMRSNGAKLKGKLKKPEKTIKPKVEADELDASALIAALGGSGVVLTQEIDNG